MRLRNFRRLWTDKQLTLIVVLEVLATNHSCQKRGYATTLVKHGFNMADGLGYASYLDAEKDAVGLYVRAGFEPKGNLKISTFMPMLRPARSEQE